MKDPVAVDNAHLCCSHNSASGIIILQIKDLQVFNNSFCDKELIFKTFNSNINKLCQFQATGVPLLDHSCSPESKVAANADTDTSTQTNRKALVMAVPDTKDRLLF